MRGSGSGGGGGGAALSTGAAAGGPQEPWVVAPWEQHAGGHHNSQVCAWSRGAGGPTLS